MYFFIIRPQKKKEKAEKQMRENLQVGDEILTIGGIYGRVISLKEDSIVIFAIEQQLSVQQTNELLYEECRKTLSGSS